MFTNKPYVMRYFYLSCLSKKLCQRFCHMHRSILFICVKTYSLFSWQSCNYFCAIDLYQLSCQFYTVCVLSCFVLVRLHGPLLSTWIRTSSKVWDEITYPFSNFNRCSWGWISNLTPHCVLHVMAHPSWG